jgi:hypothetical protein
MPRRVTHVAIVLCLAFRTASPANATIGFQPPVSYPVGTVPAAVVAADFNRDGISDLAVVNSGSGDVSILLGNGNGTFQAAINFDADMTNPAALAAGDFNQDRNLDLAVFQPGVISVLLGNGDGSFQGAKTLTLTSTAVEMFVADFNLDKKLDLAISDYDPSTSAETIDILLGKGDGTFQSAKQTSVSGGGPFTVGDLNGDEKPDLAVSGTHTIDIYLGNGDSTFRQTASVDIHDVDLPDTTIGNLGATFFANDLRIADVNNDGKADIVALAEGLGFACVKEGSGKVCAGTPDRAEKISLFLGAGGGAFLEEQNIESAFRLFSGGQLRGSQIIGMRLGDFDGNGTIDVANRGCNPGCVLELQPGQADGTFAPAMVVPDAGPLLCAEDLNGDQVTDLVVPDNANPNTIDVLLNTAPAYSMTGSATALTVSPGQQATDSLIIAGHNRYSSAVHLSCEVSGPAPLPTCSLSPTDITAGANPVTSLLTISVPANAVNAVAPAPEMPQLPAYALAVPFALGLFSIPKRAGAASRRWLRVTLLGAATLVYSACGGNRNIGDPPPHQPKSYSVAITAASSTITKTLQISLTAL